MSFSSPRPTTSNPKRRTLTGAEPLTGSGEGALTSNVSPHPANPSANGVGGGNPNVHDLDPMVLWAAEDVPVEMLARPHTSNPRYVDGLMTSRGASETPHKPPIVDTGGGFVGVAGSVVGSNSNVSPVAAGTPLNGTNNASESTTVNGASNSIIGNITSVPSANNVVVPTAPILWSDNMCIDPQLLARPVTANPWLQRVFDSVEKLIPNGVDDAVLEMLMNSGSTPFPSSSNIGASPTSAVAGGGPTSLVTSPSMAAQREKAGPEILWSSANVTDWRLLARPHSSNPIMEKVSQSQEGAMGGVGRSTSKQRTAEPSGSYVLWSRDDSPTHNNNNANQRRPSLGEQRQANINAQQQEQINRMAASVEHQAAQLAMMERHIAVLEAICLRAGLQVPPMSLDVCINDRPAAAIATNNVLGGGLEGGRRDPSPPATHVMSFEGGEDVGSMSTSARPKTAGTNNNLHLPSIPSPSVPRPITAIPNDPSIRLDANSRGGSQQQQGGGMMGGSLSARNGRAAASDLRNQYVSPISSSGVNGGPSQQQPNAAEVAAVDTTLIRELSNAEVIDVKPLLRHPRDKDGTDATSSEAFDYRHNGAMATSPLPLHSRMSFGGGDASPSPVSVSSQHRYSTYDDNDDEDEGKQPTTTSGDDRGPREDTGSPKLIPPPVIPSRTSPTTADAPTNMGGSSTSRPRTAGGTRMQAAMGGPLGGTQRPPPGSEGHGVGADIATPPPIPRLTDDDDEGGCDDGFEVFNPTEEELASVDGPNTSKPPIRARPTSAKPNNSTLTSAHFARAHTQGHPTATGGGGSLSPTMANSDMPPTPKDDEGRPRSAGRVIAPAPPKISYDSREGRPSSASRAESDLYIREDKGELADEEAVEMSFQRGFQRRSQSPTRQVGGGPAYAPRPSNTGYYAAAAASSARLGTGIISTAASGVGMHTGLSMPPRPESALPSRRAARLRLAIGQCRPTTAPTNRLNQPLTTSGLLANVGSPIAEDESISRAMNPRPATASVPSVDSANVHNYSRPATASRPLASDPPRLGVNGYLTSSPPQRRCASATLTRPFLDTTRRHVGAIDTPAFGQQRDQDIRKEYANILRRGEHAVTKDDFKALYLERALEFGVAPSDNDVEDLMAPFCSQGVDHLSIDEFAVLYLKMTAW